MFSVITVETGSVQYIKILICSCTFRNRKFLRSSIILFILHREGTKIIIDRSLMFHKIHSISFQEIRLISIGGIYIIILPVQTHNIPCMSLCTVSSISFHINAVDSKSFQKILNRTCVSCAHCLFLPESSGYALIIL